MTEAEWLECYDPDPMLECLRGRCSDRKLRLLACACCRRVLSLEQLVPHDLRMLFVQPPSPEEYAADLELMQDAVTLSEDFAEGRGSEEQRVIIADRLLRHPVTGCPAGYDLCQAAKPNWTPIAAFEFMMLTADAAIREPLNAVAAVEFSSLASASISFLKTGPDVAAHQVEQNMALLCSPRAAYETAFRFRQQDGGDWQWVADTEVEEANGYAILAAFATSQAGNCDLIRDIFGPLPFGLVSLDPTCITPAVHHLAQSIYDDRAFDQLPILADALEEAGCTRREILDHCRGPGPHVRGCWAVDLILARA